MDFTFTKQMSNQIKWEILPNFFGLLRKSELYLWVVSNCELKVLLTFYTTSQVVEPRLFPSTQSVIMKYVCKK